MRVRVRCNGRWERREREILLEVKLIVKHLANRRTDVDLVLIQQTLQVDRPQIRAALLESVRRVVPRFAYGAVVQEVLIQLGLFQNPIVVFLAKLEHRQAVLCCVWLQDVCEMGGLGFGRDTQAVWSVTREAGLRIHPRLSNPDGVVLLDSCPYGALQPIAVSIDIRPVKLVVNLQCHVREEWWLRATEIVAATAVQDLPIVLDLEDEMLHHAFSHTDLAIDEQTQRNEIRIPIVQLGEKIVLNGRK